MRKILWLGILAAVAAALLPMARCIGERAFLGNSLIRMHIVADSDSPRDQALKLQVRDGVTAWLAPALEDVGSFEEAKARLESLLPGVEAKAREILEGLGCDAPVRAGLGREAFPRRDYDTFSLPSGVYESLRLVIGPGEGENWWCVVFPSLCVSAAEFEENAAQCGMGPELGAALRGEEGYEIRFFLLDCLGRLENFFHRG